MQNLQFIILLTKDYRRGEQMNTFENRITKILERHTLKLNLARLRKNRTLYNKIKEVLKKESYNEILKEFNIKNENFLPFAIRHFIYNALDYDLGSFINIDEFVKIFMMKIEESNLRKEGQNYENYDRSTRI